MRALTLGAAVAACVLAISPARADEYIILEERAVEFDAWDAPFTDHSGPITIISTQTGIPVVTLEEQHTRTGLGYGGLLIANSLAAETGRTFDEIVALKQSGQGWGRIAKDHNVKLGPIVSRTKRADASFREIKVKTNKGQTKIKTTGGQGNRGSGGGKVKIKGGGGGNMKVHGGGQGKGHGGGGGGKGHGGGGGKGKVK